MRCTRTNSGTLNVLPALLVLLLLTGCDVHSNAKTDEMTSIQEVIHAGSFGINNTLLLRGRVTYVDGALKMFILEDNTGGIRVSGAIGSEKVAVGNLVEVRGGTSRGGESALVDGSQVRILQADSGPKFTAAVPFNPTSALRLQYRLVEVEGIVSSVDFDHDGRLSMSLRSNNLDIHLRIRDVSGNAYRRMVGAAIQATGVLSVSLDAEGSTVAVGLWLQNMTYIRVLQPPAGAARNVALHASPERTLQTAAEIHQLSESEAAQAYPIHLHAIVTYRDPIENDTFVQDATGGTFLLAQEGQSFDISAGDVVEVDGFSGPGGFAPVVIDPEVRVVGKATLPAALQLPIEQLSTGIADSELVRVHGIVRSIRSEANHTILSAGWGTYRYEVILRGGVKLPPELIGAEILVEGVCGAVTNHRRQLLGIEISVADPGSLRVVRLPQANLPVEDINQIHQYTPAPDLSQRSRVRGIVTLSHPTGPTYIADKTGGLLISTHARAILHIGEEIEAVGFASPKDFGTMLEDAQLTKVSNQTQPLGRPYDSC